MSDRPAIESNRMSKSCTYFQGYFGRVLATLLQAKNSECLGLYLFEKKLRL
jgi:hypothetical protein